MLMSISNLIEHKQNSSTDETNFETPQRYQQEIQSSSFNNFIKQTSQQQSPRSSEIKETGIDFYKNLYNFTQSVNETQLLYQDNQDMKQDLSFNNDNMKNNSIFQNLLKQELIQEQQQQKQLQLQERQQFQEILLEQHELVLPQFIKRQSETHIISSTDQLLNNNTSQIIDNKTSFDNNYLEHLQDCQNVESIVQNHKKNEVNQDKYSQENPQYLFKFSSLLEKEKLDLENNQLKEKQYTTQEQHYDLQQNSNFISKLNSFQKQNSDLQNLNDPNQYDIFEIIGNNTIESQQGNFKNKTELFQILNNQQPTPELVVDNQELCNRFDQQHANKISNNFLIYPDQQINSKKDSITQEIPSMTEKQIQTGFKLIQRPASLQLQPTYLNQQFQGYSANNNLKQSFLSDQQNNVQKNITKLRCTCPKKLEIPQMNPSNCGCIKNYNQPMIINNQITQYTNFNKSQFNKPENLQMQRTQNNPNVNQVYYNQSQNNTDKFKFTEKQFNMVDYAFLNEQDGLSRMHFRTRNEQEYLNIMQTTSLMIKKMTLDNDGHHFKFNGDMKQLFELGNCELQVHQSEQYNNNQYYNQKFLNNQSNQQQQIINNQKYIQSNSLNDKQNSIHQQQHYLNDKKPDINPLEQNDSSLVQKPKQLQLNIKVGDQIQVSPNGSQKEIHSHSDQSHSGYQQNQYRQKQFNNYNNNHAYRHHHINDDLHDEDHQERHIMRHEEESFEKSSNNLTSEQWLCIQQLQKHKKKNVAKNIMTAFKNFISHPMKFGYTQQQIGSALSCYNKSKNIEESFDEMQNKFMKYIVKKKFNHYTIKLLIQHPNYGEVFEYFLKQLADFWLEQSKVHDTEAHLAMIKFLKEAYNDIEIINQLKKYDKRKY